MIAELLIALALHGSADGGAVAKKKPTASQLSAPMTDGGSKGAPVALDGGVARTMNGGVALEADGGVNSAASLKPAKTPMTPEVKALVDRMQAFYEKTDDFTASFRQDYLYKLAKRTTTSTGTVTFKKPALMRWEYLTPEKKTFVLAGDTVYAHDPAAMMLTVASINTSQLSASVTFLWGKGKLADEFNIAEGKCDKCTGTLLELTPIVPDPRFQRVKLEVDPKSAQVLRSVVIDPDGSENAITFSGLKANVGANAETFKLNPPQGTQVQDFRKKQ